MNVSIIIPAYNEENAIKTVIEEVKDLKMKSREIIVVDDGSTDKTYDTVKNVKGIKILQHKRNMGKGIALRTGMEHSKGDVIVTIDADGTYPAKSIPKLLEKIGDGHDLAIGSRFLERTGTIPRIRCFGNMIFSGLISLIVGREITDASSGLRAFRKHVLKDMKITSRNLSWEVEMTTKALKKGFMVAEIPIDYAERIGKSKLRIWKDGFSFLFAILGSAV